MWQWLLNFHEIQDSLVLTARASVLWVSEHVHLFLAWRQIMCVQMDAHVCSREHHATHTYTHTHVQTRRDTTQPAHSIHTTQDTHADTQTPHTDIHRV
jgi:hypothetical protein